MTVLTELTLLEAAPPSAPADMEANTATNSFTPEPAEMERAHTPTPQPTEAAEPDSRQGSLNCAEQR